MFKCLVTLLLLMLFINTNLLSKPPTEEDKAAFKKAKNFQETDQSELAFPIFLKLAEKDNVLAQFIVGKMYFLGDGIPQDDSKAFLWIFSAANYEHAEAQNSLGLMYDEGWGVTKDDRKAAHWYYQSASQGFTKAQVNMGMMFCLGEGARKSMEQCVYWIKKAKEKGSVNANNAWVSFELEKYDREP